MAKRGPSHCPLVVAALLIVVSGARPAAAQSTLSALETDVDRVAAAARPSVVTVFAQRSLPRPRGAAASAPRRLQTRVGSGVAVQDDAVLTSASVTQDAEHVMVRTANGIQVE